MKPKNRKDFERVIRRFCREHGLEHAVRQPGTSHCSHTIKSEDGNVVASITLVGGKKDISPGTLRGILKSLTDQESRHSTGFLSSILRDLIDELKKWTRR